MPTRSIGPLDSLEAYMRTQGHWGRGPWTAAEKQDAAKQQKAESKFDAWRKRRRSRSGDPRVKAESLVKKLDRMGLRYNWRVDESYGSNYIEVQEPESGEWITIRVSDHAPPKGRGGYGSDEYGLVGHTEADVSFHPGGHSIVSATKVIKAALKKVRMANPQHKGRGRNGLFSYLGGESYSLKGSKKLLIPTKVELQQAARQAGREYGKRDRESGRGIKYSNMLVAFKDWIASMPQLPRGVSERDLKVKFTGGYHTADILRNPFSIGETIAIGAGSAVGGAIGSAFVEPLIGKVKGMMNRVGNPITFEQAKQMQAEIEQEVRLMQDRLREVKEGVQGYLEGPMGLTPDKIKSSPQYRMAKVGVDRATKKLQDFNKLFVKRFKKELRDEQRKYGYGKRPDMKNPFQPKNRRGNPLDVDTSISISPKVLQMAESFHGREVETITDYEELDNYESELADLGELRELEIIAKGRKSVIALTFDKDCPRLACRADGKQLYFVGGDQELSEDVLEDLKRKGADELSVHGGTLEKGDKRILPIGTVHTIAYFADKHHLEGTRKQRKGVEYAHTFGEENGVKPVLAYDVMNQGMILLGGDYRVEDVGIVN